MLLLSTNAVRAQQSMQHLAAAAQTPVGAMYSLPFQDTIYGGAGPNHDATANVLNIQPVIPITVGDWNIISRTIAPLIYLPSLTTGPSEITEQSLFSSSHFGLGDINQSFYFSPAKAAELIWGAGPSFNLPTSTATPLGSAKFSMGPAAVALTMPKPWVIGALARQLWSVKGPSNRTDVSQFLLQPFVNYNMEEGWYLTSSPVITANWLASSNKWAVPIGAGIGKIFRIGDQPMNGQLRAVANRRTDMGRTRPTAIPVSAVATPDLSGPEHLPAARSGQCSGARVLVSTVVHVSSRPRGAEIKDFPDPPRCLRKMKCHRVCKVEMTPAQSHSAAPAARALRNGRPFVGIPVASRLFGGRWRRGSPRLRFGGYDACSSRANASAGPSRLFSTIAPGATVWILSNTRHGSATP